MPKKKKPAIIDATSTEAAPEVRGSLQPSFNELLEDYVAQVNILKEAKANIEELTELLDNHPEAAMLKEVFQGAKPPSNGQSAPSKSKGSAAKLEEVKSYIADNPGQRTESISAGLGFDAKPYLAKLRLDKAVKTKGNRRAMTYSPA